MAQSVPAWAQALIAEVQSLREQVASAPVRPSAQTRVSPFPEAVADGDHKMARTRAYNAEHKVPRKHCPTCGRGFVYEKAEHCGRAL